MTNRFGAALWSTSNSSLSFDSGSVPLSDSTYKIFLVVMKYTTGYGHYGQYVVYKDRDTMLYLHNDSGSDTSYVRNVIIDGSSATFGKCRKYVAGAGSVDESSGMIPYDIFGLV